MGLSFAELRSLSSTWKNGDMQCYLDKILSTHALKQDNPRTVFDTRSGRPGSRESPGCHAFSESLEKQTNK